MAPRSDIRGFAGVFYGSGDCPTTASVWSHLEVGAELRAWALPETAVAHSGPFSAIFSALLSLQLQRRSVPSPVILSGQMDTADPSVDA
jgi:hypothetical protein